MSACFHGTPQWVIRQMQEVGQSFLTHAIGDGHTPDDAPIDQQTYGTTPVLHAQHNYSQMTRCKSLNSQ